MMAQLTIDTTISANWVIAALIGITAFLLVRLLNKMDSRIDSNEKQTQVNTVEIAVLKENRETSSDIATGILKAIKSEPLVKYKG